jgi:hypothetical protein
MAFPPQPPPYAGPFALWSDQWRLQQGGPRRATYALAGVHPIARFLNQEIAEHFLSQMPLEPVPVGGSLHLFRDGIRPVYDDPSHSAGGHYKMTVQSLEIAMRCWGRLACAFMVGLGAHCHCVTGVTYWRAHQTRGFKVWLSADDKPLVAAVRGAIQATLSGNEIHHLKFSPHKYILRNQSVAAAAPTTSAPPSHAGNPPPPPTPWPTGPLTTAAAAPPVSGPRAGADPLGRSEVPCAAFFPIHQSVHFAPTALSTPAATPVVLRGKRPSDASTADSIDSIGRTNSDASTSSGPAHAASLALYTRLATDPGTAERPALPHRSETSPEGPTPSEMMRQWSDLFAAHCADIDHHASWP